MRVRMESLVVAERTWPTRLVFLRHLCIFLSSLAMCVSGLACVGIMREGGPARPLCVCARVIGSAERVWPRVIYIYTGGSGNRRIRVMQTLSERHPG